MRGGALPPALLASAFGFALAFAPRKVFAPAIGAFAAAAILAAQLKPETRLVDPIFYACWISIVATVLVVHLKRPPGLKPYLALAGNAGFWAGAVVAVAGVPFDLVKSLPWVLICLPAAWLVGGRFQIAIKIVASWLIAVSLLAAALPAITPTPGYAGDHLE